MQYSFGKSVVRREDNPNKQASNGTHWALREASELTSASLIGVASLRAACAMFFAVEQMSAARVYAAAASANLPAASRSDAMAMASLALKRS